MTVVHIRWFDSQTQNGWTPLDELSEGLEITHTVGFLIHEAQEFLVIAHSYDPATESNNGLITIPKSSIKNKRTICKVKI